MEQMTDLGGGGLGRWKKLAKEHPCMYVGVWGRGLGRQGKGGAFVIVSTISK